MPAKKVALVVGVSALVVAALIAVYFVSSIREGREGVKLVIVTRLYPEEQEAIRKAFLNSSIAKEYNIIDVEFRKEDYSKWAELSESGYVDGFFVGEKYIYDVLCSEGHLSSFTLKELVDAVKRLDRRYYGMDSRGGYCWVAVGQAVYGFIINRVFLEKHGLQEPQKWSDLTKVDYLKPLLLGESTVSFPRPTKSGTSRTVVHGILQKYGWEEGWRVLTIIAMESSIVDSSEKARDEAAEGVVAVAPAYIGYGIEAEKAGHGAVFKVPKGEGILYLSLAAVASKAKHPKEMQAFILWLLSDEGQKTLARLFYYIPVREDVKGIEWVERIYSELKNNIFNYDRELATKIDKAVTAYFEAALADPDSNMLLKEIGRELALLLENKKIGLSKAHEILSSVGKLLVVKDPWTGRGEEFTLEYALSINDKLKDKEEWAKFYNAVKTAAIEHYRKILDEIKALG
jgi:ABC-type Fe3+ transport system substrate-binding protein